ncbi:type II toxin-antitoxin system HicB family antitoxin [Geminocystis sp. GBBB08]|uniref:type II toxin-antitoxin system HicB family antitoxin n=1 Tax=Geminocystis sp. GBBB08 TaxID=2604140 RepID=UPI0027E25F26|nr:type II toxin-antitoxin system HicB family antitoxin [Geminocystis sp. GBBB08]MBL1211440.1 type II toxin-antitoxin system HicB family antitoxin [Geminocystis sp. GBBB08]
MRYQVNLQKTEEGYHVWCPSLPGCASQGETKEEAIENIQDAIAVYLEVKAELNKGIESIYLEVKPNYA